MKRRLIILGVVTLSLGLAAGLQAQGTSNEPPAVQKHVDAARAMANIRYKTAMERLCMPPDKRPRPQFTDLNVEPVRLFDNLYFVGLANVYAWAYDTPDGIVMLDTLNNSKDAEVTIVGGMKKLGLDPSRIKYIIITHAHGDHFGGAPYLKEHYGAHVIASEEAWREMEGLKPGGSNFAPPPKRDMVAMDGQKFTFGGSTFTFILTPGHTRGTLSVMFPVMDKGQRHMAYVLSGPRTETPDTTSVMLTSTEKLLGIAKSGHVDVEFTNHSYIDDSLPTIEAVRHRKATEPNAYLIGEDGVQKYLGWQAECLRADLARSGKESRSN
jgi:metallo-beta-lactamase class B